DFFRDFRGDTIHPSTMEVLHELGLLDEFLALKPNRVDKLSAFVAGEPVTLGNFSGLKTRCPFIAFIPQWDFLNFIDAHASQYPASHLKKQTDATDPTEENAHATGVRPNPPTAPREVRAELVVGADGRHSTVRDKSGLKVRDIGAPMDVLW